MLGAGDFPTDNATLHAALGRAISQLGADPKGVVLEGTFPSLAAIRMDLTGARFDLKVRPSATRSSETRAFHSSVVEITATPARLETLPIDLVLRAKNCAFDCNTARDGTRSIALQECSAGEIELNAAIAGIEAALFAVAQEAAAEHGAEIQSVRVAIQSETPRRVAVTATAVAKAMFLTATLTIHGWLEIDDEFNATLSDLACTGDGMLSNLAAGYLRPRLAQFDARRFSIASLLAGNVAPTHIVLDAAPALRLRASFRRKCDTTPIDKNK